MTVTILSDVNQDIIANYDMKPNVCKRRDYTAGFAGASLPEEMSSDWQELAMLLRDLYSRLGAHPAMTRNLNQTFSTPANSKNSVYFMWDFVGRTLHQLYLVPAKTEKLSAKHKEAFNDCHGRAAMASGLILNEPAGMLEMMVKSAPHDKENPMPDMGKQVEDAARAIMNG